MSVRNNSFELKNCSVFICTLCVVCVSLFFFEGKAENWKYLKVNAENDSVPSFLFLHEGMELIGKDGCLVVRDGETVSSFPQNSRISLQLSRKASLGISLSLPHQDYGIENLPVVVSSDSEDSESLMLFTDEEGSVVIDDLVPGEYRLEVIGKERGLTAPAIEIYHQIDDNFRVELEEFPVAPYDMYVDSEVFDSEAASFDVVLKWNDDEKGASLPYRYIVSIDGHPAVAVDSTGYHFTDLEAGRHAGYIRGVTPLGTETELRHFSFTLEYPSSDFVIHLVSANESELPVEGIRVAVASLSQGDDSEILEAVSDGEGMARFAELAPGSYFVKVEDAAFPFTPFSHKGLIHGYSDEVTVRLHENVLPPVNVRHTVAEGRGGKYDVTFEWDEPKSYFFSIPEYIYIFESEGEYVGETSEFNFIIEDLVPGVYSYRVSSFSPYGNVSEGVDVEVDIDAFAGLQIIGLEDFNVWQYFDLTGKKVGENSLSPGIYIRVNGGKSEKIVIR